ncbi:AAA family ATPase [Pseudomonas siliginis]|uniref:AAA family ATPase n=1 Tax=Pseudomonas siliginis TaxID=2842346 RepID=UPI0021605950|nr:AAA family ATPase [Pseudomonas siliginis]UVL93519.1 AAA family ATPase [Pseudomonas siliginis]
MKIKKVEIEGFRAYKTKEDGTFDFLTENGDPSDFVAIYAPNGFGKSSFYDAVEWAATNHLERLGGEYNKDNYVYAAKITKEEGVGQKILRNKDVSEDIVTRVVVSTTRSEPFKREIKHIRSNSRDLRNDGKGRENEYFRRVILSQDEIDRFLREAKPQERYERFMKSFGGDVEVARKELSILINDNKSVLGDLEKQRDILHQDMQQPIDVAIFDQFNGVVSELNAAGESLPFADESFSLNTEHELVSRLVTRINELEVDRTSLNVSRATLIERLSRFPEIQLHLSLIEEQMPRLSKLTKGVEDAQRYSTLLASYSKCMNDLRAVKDRLDRLHEISQYAIEYAKTESEIASAKERANDTLLLLAEANALVKSHEDSVKKNKEELAAVDARILFLRNAVDNCGPIYSELLTRQGRLSLLDSQVSEKLISLSLDKAQHLGVESELEKVSTLKLSANSILSSDISVIKFDGAKVNDLAQYSEELDSWQRYDQTLQATQKSLSDQMGLHERLVTTGLEYLSLWPVDKCPLCNKPHDSSESLKAQITGTALLSDLSKQNAENLEASVLRQSELKSKINAIVLEAVEVQSQQLEGLRKKINELGERSSKTEREIADIRAEKEGVETQIKELQAAVWGLSKPDLEYRAEAEILALSEKRNNLLDLSAELDGHLQLNKISASDQHAKIIAINSLIENLMIGASYEVVSVFLKENALSSGELAAFCDQQKEDFELLKDKYRVESEKFSSDCVALQATMLAEETWVDFSTLPPQKEMVENQIAKSQSLVEAFRDSVSRLIGPQNNKDLNQLKGNISQAIDRFADTLEVLGGKISKISLLLELIKAFKPYLTSLAFKERLVEVERRLSERNQVDSVLAKELEVVVENLKILVNSFFYEDLINAIYRKIDPHPSFKRVEFKPDFSLDRPGLNIIVKDEMGNSISPILYFSAAQSNILSLSVFLANALHAKDDEGVPVDVIMIDDPIQSMDSINVLATIDLLRSICMQFQKQIIISTHDENFFGLLQRKIPSEVFGSKFLKLEKFGVAVPVEPFNNRGYQGG